MKRVTVVHTFDVPDNTPDDAIDNVVATMTVQVEEPVVGYDEHGNELVPAESWGAVTSTYTMGEDRPFVLAVHDTRSFSWHGLGRTEEEADQALLDVYAAHCKQTPDADPELMAEAVADGVTHYWIALGVGLRDGTEVNV